VQQPEQQRDGRRLAGAVRAEQGENLAATQIELHLIEGQHSAVALAGTFQLRDRLFRSIHRRLRLFMTQGYAPARHGFSREHHQLRMTNVRL